MTRVYIAGPMTGIPAFNFPAFDQMAGLLRRQGFDVVSPAELDDPAIRAISMASPDGSPATLATHGQTHGDFLARDVKIIADGGIEAIVVLPGWERSKGARHETFVGKALNGIPIVRVTAVIGDLMSLDTVPDLELFRAWTQEPTLAINRAFGQGAVL